MLKQLANKSKYFFKRDQSINVYDGFDINIISLNEIFYILMKFNHEIQNLFDLSIRILTEISSSSAFYLLLIVEQKIRPFK